MGDTAPDEARRGALFFALLAGPLAWTAELLTNYYFSSLACRRTLAAFTLFGRPGFSILIFGVEIATALLGIAAGLVAWRHWQQTAPAHADALAGVDQRVPFMALGAMLLSGLFLLIILVSGIPNLVLGCATQ